MARFEHWRTSSRNGNGGQCVAISRDPGLVGIRDTKDRDGGTLIVDPHAFDGFIAAIKDGHLS